MHPLLYAATAWLAADIVTGAVHWWEDRYGNPAWPVIGKLVVEPNIRHHSEPRAFLEGNYWHRNWTTIVPAGLIALACYLAGQYWLALVAAFATQANEIHGWAHQKCSRYIRGLQLLGLITSQEGHAQHHQSPFSTDFCVMTDWTNPLLSGIRFWRALEWLVGLTGIHPRVERELA
jgi:hypothetical protein